MNLHEFQAKAILRECGMPVPAGRVVETAEQAEVAAREIGGSQWMVKAQILAGARAQGAFKGLENGPGICSVVSADEARAEAHRMLGHNLVTSQTTADGMPVEQVYVEEAIPVDREVSLAVLVDEVHQRVSLLFSPRGGTDIEATLKAEPDEVAVIPVSLDGGPDAAQLDRSLAQFGVMGSDADTIRALAGQMVTLVRNRDLILLEINPVGLLEGRGIALDAKMIADDNALHRQANLRSMEDEAAGGHRLKASSDGFNYIRMGGDIACMTSGAGLSMATLDALIHFDGKPANFLDLPPDSKVNRVTSALELLVGGDGIRCLFVNIFGGGIMRCDTVSDAIQILNRVHPLRIPLVVRLAGTNAELASRRIQESMPGVVLARNMSEGAQLAVQLARTGKSADPGVPENWLQKIIHRVTGQSLEGRG